ncbi:MAG TPA: SRPBCC family protein [Thermoleophilaceae bacterium]|jgi:uncharacterized protein YndB with AHSA1/START domain
MPSFADTARSDAPPEEVWKLLYDPSRFPDWWAGAASVEGMQDDGGGSKTYTLYPEGYPDFPMPQLLESAREGSHVVISCQVSDLRFEWRLEPDGAGTRIDVLVDIPEKEAFRLDQQRDMIRRSLMRLAQVATPAPL